MGSLADVTLGDIGRALARYRPVAVTVGIILVVVALLPGPRGAALRSLGSVPPPAAATTDVAAGDEASVPADSTVPAEELPGPTTFDSSSSFSSSSSTFDSSSSGFSSGDSSSSGSSAPAPTFDFSDEGTPGASSSSVSRPLVVVSAGWASATGATPLGSTGVPAKTLPVGKRIGQVDKYSFVRLEGDDQVLTLRVNAEGTRAATTGAVGISICQITDANWQAAENVPSDRAPKYDTSTCVPGDPGDGTAWSFNLVTFSSSSDPRGFALVPTGDSIDYQVAFERT